ncbi:universal stress protein [soil metagenome]
MKRILIATDLSSNSEAALHFVWQAAGRGAVAPTFLYVHNVLRPTTWHQSKYFAYEQQELAHAQQRLEQFVDLNRQRLKVTAGENTCVVINSAVVDRAIMGYAAEHQFDYICIGARGAGALEKLFGTTAATLINQSAIPVIAVPASYRPSPVKQVLYASDLTNVVPELNQVIDFARPLGASVNLVHFMETNHPVITSATLQKTIRQFTDYEVTIDLEAALFGHTLVDNLEQVIQGQQPSLLVMFTTPRSGFLQRLVSPSHSAEYAFIGSVPLLVFTRK